jgi:hypothetical protein
MSQPPAHRVRRRPGFFHPVILRRRSDGWAIARECAFLAHLYHTGSPTAAARAVGMSRESAHRLRAREGAEGFAHAWDRVLTHPGSGRCERPAIDYRKVTVPTLQGRVETGLVRPVIARGRMTAIALKADNSSLLRLLRRLDQSCTRAVGEG